MVFRCRVYVLLTLALALACFAMGCHPPEFSSEAERLASMTGEEMKAEFIRLGTLSSSPGPMAIGDVDGKSGLLMLSKIPWLDQKQQDIAYQMVWTGKNFHVDESVPCSTEQGGSFWVENKLKTIFKAIYLAEGSGEGEMFYSNDSWTGDGKGIIQIDYSNTTPALGFIHDEMRLAKWDKQSNTATYLGFMWVKFGPVKYAFAYFIPDQLTPYECP